jgi:hypothetical protein
MMPEKFDVLPCELNVSETLNNRLDFDASSYFDHAINWQVEEAACAVCSTVQENEKVLLKRVHAGRFACDD